MALPIDYSWRFPDWSFEIKLLNALTVSEPTTMFYSFLSFISCSTTRSSYRKASCTNRFRFLVRAFIDASFFFSCFLASGSELASTCSERACSFPEMFSLICKIMNKGDGFSIFWSDKNWACFWSIYYLEEATSCSTRRPLSRFVVNFKSYCTRSLRDPINKRHNLRLSESRSSETSIFGLFTVVSIILTSAGASFCSTGSSTFFSSI